MRDITLLGDTSTETLCGPRRLLLVQWLNSLVLIVHSSSSNMVFKIAKRLFNGHEQKVKFVHGPRIWFALSRFKCISPIYFQISSENHHKKFRNQRFLVRHRTIHFSQKILSRDPVPLEKDDSKTPFPWNFVGFSERIKNASS
jgi:hypothetical protein